MIEETTEKPTRQETGHSPMAALVERAMGQRLQHWVEAQPRDVYEARMKAFSQIVNAMPEGAIREQAQKLRPVVSASATVEANISHVKSLAWKIAQPVLTAEVPLLGVISSDVFPVVDTMMADVSGRVGSAVIRGGVQVGKRAHEFFMRMPRTPDAIASGILSGFPGFSKN